MAELKTKENDASVETFLATVSDEKRKADTRTVMEMLECVTGCPPKMWGTSIIGFDSYDYTYESGRSGTWFVTGVSPRKQALTIYIMQGFGAYEDLMGKLGKYKTGKSCLYVKKLEDIDMKVLEKLARESMKWIRKNYS
ncbi:DUF1801 domain-containing protein [Parvibaculaceae bacterium PLY_AMNH_Bact1]|nr:DUF1801 domain-containing protein [Parvibaculaceae bacterium PLY_AMNH_Bact1]